MNSQDTTISRWISAHPEELAATDILSDGDNVDGYVVRRFLGRGKSGEVYEVWHKVLNASFALKIYDPKTDADVARLFAEVRALAKVRHPNIVAIHHFGEYKGHPYFVMDLAERLPDQIPLGECRRLVAGIAAALGKLHDAGIIHRDVKPQNILVRDGEFLLADFSIVSNDSDIPCPGLENPTIQGGSRMVVGTHGYISPEVLEGGEATPSSDQFGLAATCLAVCGAIPKNRRAMSVVQRALNAKPSLRYASVEDFAAAFSKAASPFRVLRVAAVAAFAAAALLAAAIYWIVVDRNDMDSATRGASKNESFNRYDPASDSFSASSKNSLRERLGAYEKELSEVKGKIAAKRAEILGPYKGVNPFKIEDIERRQKVCNEIGDAQLRFGRETDGLVQRQLELENAIRELNEGR